MDLEKVNVEKELKIVFMGTPMFAVPILEALIQNYHVRAIVTQPDRAVGREQKITYPPVKKVGLEHTILVLQPARLSEEYQEIIDLHPDLIITCAYGQIIPKELLKEPRLGCINVHPSLLPKLRGGAPIHHAIIDGYKETGVTIMYMNERMDEGDIISQRKCEITDTDTAETLHNKLSIIGRDLLLETLPSIINGTNSRTPQDQSQVTYGMNITREDEQISFDKTKREIHNQIRGLNNFPGAFCYLEGKILKVWDSYITYENYPNLLNGQITKIYPDGFGVKVSNGEIVFKTVQLEGKTKMNAYEFANGRDLVGKILS